MVGCDDDRNQNSALAVDEVLVTTAAERAGIVRGLVLTSVNGTRVRDAATGKRMAATAEPPVVLGFDEPEAAE